MRRTCLLLLVLPAGLSAAADNPFSKPASSSPTRTLIARLAETEEPAAASPTAEPMVQPSLLTSPVRQIPIVGVAGPIQEPSSGSSQDDPSTVVETTEPDLSKPADDGDDDYDFDAPLRRPDQQNPLFGPSIYGSGRLARIVDERIAIPPLITPTTATTDIGSKKLPDDLGGEALVAIKPLPEGFDRFEDWALTGYFWQAPNTFSHPLYFDDPMLERHGHERFPALTPVTSGLRFFATIPMLPYLATVQEPCDYVYTLGHFRPGSCAPTLLKRPPYERRAAVVQALSTAGAFIALP